MFAFVDICINKTWRDKQETVLYRAGGEWVDKVIVTCDNSQFVNFYFVLTFEQCKCIICLKFNLIKTKTYTAKSVLKCCFK